MDKTILKNGIISIRRQGCEWVATVTSDNGMISESEAHTAEYAIGRAVLKHIGASPRVIEGMANKWEEFFK